MPNMHAKYVWNGSQKALNTRRRRFRSLLIAGDFFRRTSRRPRPDKTGAGAGAGVCGTEFARAAAVGRIIPDDRDRKPFGYYYWLPSLKHGTVGPAVFVCCNGDVAKTAREL